MIPQYQFNKTKQHTHTIRIYLILIFRLVIIMNATIIIYNYIHK